jgi:hypothetical protein
MDRLTQTTLTHTHVFKWYASNQQINIPFIFNISKLQQFYHKNIPLIHITLKPRNFQNSDQPKSPKGILFGFHHNPQYGMKEDSILSFWKVFG